MKRYTLSFNKLFFRCLAEDEEHAKEQFLNYIEGTIEVIEVIEVVDEEPF